MRLPEEQFEDLIEQILDHGYGIVDDFLTIAQTLPLTLQLQKRHDEGLFKIAGIGQGADFQIQTRIRGDEILWLDAHKALVDEQVFWDKINAFIFYINRTCFMGLKDGEFHYALYPVGTFYKRHLDKFRQDSRRKLSFICYLNQDWIVANGGELTLYLPHNQTKIISPLAGRVVCFEADKLEHEVLPALHPRMSLTGWLRQ
jgi:SM-20-related protein